MKLIRADVLTKISKETPDFECSWKGNEFGIEVTTRARREAGLAMHDLLEKGLSDGPDVGVTLIRSGKLLFSEDPAKTAAIAADQVVTAIKERVHGRGGPASHRQHPDPRSRAHRHAARRRARLRAGHAGDLRAPLTDEQREHHWKMAALHIKDPIEKKGRKTYGLPSIVVLDVSRLGSAGQAPADASWTGKFQDVLDACELGNLNGALVVRSELMSELLQPLCWRGEESLAAAAAVLLGGQMPKAA